MFTIVPATCGRLLEGAQSKLHVVREQDPHPAETVLQRQDLGFELDPIVAANVRPHVGFGGLLDQDGET